MDTLNGKVEWLKKNDGKIKEWVKKNFVPKGVHNAQRFLGNPFQLQSIKESNLIKFIILF